MAKEKFNMQTHFVGDTAGAAKSSRIVQKVFTGVESSSQVAEEAETGRFTISEIPVDDITPRSINRYSQSRIERLAKSIRNTNNRLIHPIIVVRVSDLPETSDVITAFKAKGVDVSSLKYVIVAGERRFTAWKLLRGEAAADLKKKEEQGLIGVSNPFDTITANVLTKKEAKNEAAYYEDSNVESRSLTPNEALSHVKQAFDEIQTPQQKRQALIDMNKVSANPVPEESIPEDAVRVDAMFNAAEYFKWYLEAELGIEGWSDSKIKQYQAVVKKCIPEVVDAVMDGKMSFTDARNLTIFDPPSQQGLLKLLLDGNKAEFDEKVSPRKRDKMPARVTNVDAKRKVKSIEGKLIKERDSFRKIIVKLGEDDKKIGNKVISKIDALLAELAEAEKALK